MTNKDLGVLMKKTLLLNQEKNHNIFTFKGRGLEV